MSIENTASKGTGMHNVFLLTKIIPVKNGAEVIQRQREEIMHNFSFQRMWIPLVIALLIVIHIFTNNGGYISNVPFFSK